MNDNLVFAKKRKLCHDGETNRTKYEDFSKEVIFILFAFVNTQSSIYLWKNCFRQQLISRIEELESRLKGTQNSSSSSSLLKEETCPAEDSCGKSRRSDKKSRPFDYSRFVFAVVLELNDLKKIFINRFFRICPVLRRHRCSFRTVAFKLLYLGWDYDGFVTQDNTTNTIENHLFNALKKACMIESREKSNYHRCGRTDQAVSSFSQVIFPIFFFFFWNAHGIILCICLCGVGGR